MWRSCISFNANLSFNRNNKTIDCKPSCERSYSCCSVNVFSLYVVKVLLNLFSCGEAASVSTLTFLLIGTIKLRSTCPEPSPGALKEGNVFFISLVKSIAVALLLPCENVSMLIFSAVKLSISVVKFSGGRNSID